MGTERAQAWLRCLTKLLAIKVIIISIHSGQKKKRLELKINTLVERKEHFEHDSSTIQIVAGDFSFEVLTVCKFKITFNV